ncbi:MAG: SDR family oxidoreductase [Armatimonadaceae bacterium]
MKTNGSNGSNGTSRNGRLQDKVAIVTGAGTGIGEAICLKFAMEGAKVLACGLPTDPVDDVVQNIRTMGYDATPYKGDLSREADAEACVQAAVDLWGKLDILINNAGVLLTIAETQEYPLEDFDTHIKNNLYTTFLMTRFALPHLQKTQGSIVSAGSEAGYNGLAQNTPYGGTKAFIHALMKGVAVEQAKYNVRANCVCPGAIDTAMTHPDEGPMTKKMEKMIIGATPLGRRGTPQEMANVYCFLASDEASYVTGALWLADGGITIAKGMVGEEAKSEAKTPPKGPVMQAMEHAREGDRNKETHTLA